MNRLRASDLNIQSIQILDWHREQTWDTHKSTRLFGMDHVMAYFVNPETGTIQEWHPKALSVKADDADTLIGVK